MSLNPVCERALSLLDPYLDSELSAELAAAVANHLAQCAKCKAEAAVQKLMKETVHASVNQPAPQALRAKVQQRLMSQRVEWADGVVVSRTIRIEVVEE